MDLNNPDGVLQALDSIDYLADDGLATSIFLALACATAASEPDQYPWANQKESDRSDGEDCLVQWVSIQELRFGSAGFYYRSGGLGQCKSQ